MNKTLRKLGIIALMIGLGFLAGAFHAHAGQSEYFDPGTPPSVGDWYKTLRSNPVEGYPQGLSCCDESDCGPVDTHFIDGHWEYASKVDGKYRPVPDDRILDGFSQDPSRKAVVCELIGSGPNTISPIVGEHVGDNHFVMCFVRPTQLY